LPISLEHALVIPRSRWFSPNTAANSKYFVHSFIRPHGRAARNGWSIELHGSLSGIDAAYRSLYIQSTLQSFSTHTFHLLHAAGDAGSAPHPVLSAIAEPVRRLFLPQPPFPNATGPQHIRVGSFGCCSRSARFRNAEIQYRSSVSSLEG
jgi:hypothetical protein